jgi:hypothetical protein
MTYLAKTVGSLHAAYVLGLANHEDIYEFAIRELREPVDDNLLAICICDKTDQECVINAAQDLFTSHGLIDVSMQDVLRTLAFEISTRILDGSLPVRSGAELLVYAVLRSELTDFHELDAFRYAVSEMEERPNDIAFFERALIEEAARWASAGPKT